MMREARVAAGVAGFMMRMANCAKQVESTSQYAWQRAKGIQTIKGFLNRDNDSSVNGVAPVYLGITKDTTNGAVLYYSPKAQKILSSRSKEYKLVLNWRWDELRRVYPTGVGKDDFAFYKYKKN
ncbi:protein of unknown function [Legionella fallonii LLAP-10]|uniref:Uncharacterized protein n=1 Tax=Legionella fallonii LLAP-10 TaxID=1212491 RepID=A0A098G2R1_9GAMM|nr:protein of unknown function [Legionella fallonii LLAP-10]